MVGVCEELINILESEDEPRVAVRLMLETLRQPRPEVAAAGIKPADWEAALDALLASVDEADAADVEARRKPWSGVKRDLERLGCRVSPLNAGGDSWSIQGAGVDVEVDLSSGRIEGLGYGPKVRFEDLVSDVERMIGFRERELANKARRAALRNTHRWDSRLKGWVPKDGQGPIIPGGGHA